MADWRNVKDAAKLLNRSGGQVRRCCARWALEGKAKLVRGGGRRSRYLIDVEAVKRGGDAPSSPIVVVIIPPDGESIGRLSNMLQSIARG